MNILYGCCFKADLHLPGITYVDIIPNLKKSNNCAYICSDIYDVNFNKFDVLILTPPCNYYSKCNYRRDVSQYALATKNLLKFCIIAAVFSGKPFLIENVRNSVIFKQEHIYEICDVLGVLVYTYGRHTYFTNRLIDFTNVPQRQDFTNGGYVIKYDDMHNKEDHQGGFNVNNCIHHFLYSMGVI